MTNNLKRITCAMLAALTLTLVACSSSDADDGSISEAQSSEVVETTTKDPNADDLPEGLDLEGRDYTFYIAGDGLGMYFAGPEEESGDVVQDTVLLRNRTVEERLNIKLDPRTFDTKAPGGHADMNPEVTNIILSGDTTYDLFYYQQFNICKLATSDYFINVNDLDYIDFDKPYWDLAFMDEMTLNQNKRIFMVGDYFIDLLLQLRVTFYNKDMYGDRYGDPNGLYNIVLDGEWTLDKMIEIINASYEDLNTNDSTDNEDRLGLVCWGLGGSVDPMAYGTDIDFLKRNSDGSVEVTMMCDDSFTLAEKMNELFNNKSNLVVNSSEEQLSVFKSGNTQFIGLGRLLDADFLRDMESDFGFLPIAKFDEEQDGYRSLVQDCVAVAAIPTTSQTTDTIGAVLEALNYESSKTLTPTWYETALKIKYTRDDISSQMIDLIHNSATTNFLYAYNYALNGLGLIYRNLVIAKSTDFASTYATLEPAALEALEGMTEYFNS